MAQILQAAAMLGLDLDRCNVGAGVNPSGKTVRFGKPGDSDLAGQIDRGPNAGRVLQVEIKAEGFDPSKLRGAKRAHFERQLARLRRTNEQGGIAFFCDNSEVFIRVMRIVLRGGWVEERGEGGLTVYDPEIIEEKS